MYPAMQGKDFATMSNVYLLASAKDVKTDSFLLVKPEVIHAKYKHKDYTLVIGIPVYGSLPREHLFRCLDTVLQPAQMNNHSSHKIISHFVIGLMDNTVSSKNNLLTSLSTRYRAMLIRGDLEIIIPNSHIYSAIDDNLSYTQNIFVMRNILNAYIINYSADKGDYFLWLGDNVIAADSYITNLETFLNSVLHKLWISMALSSPDRIIGQLFQMQTATYMASLILASTRQEPIEVLEAYLQMIYPRCADPKKTTRPSCLQELGYASPQHRPSIFDIVHTSETPVYDEMNLVNMTLSSFSNYPIKNEAYPWGHIPIYTNPPAMLSSTMKTVGNHRLESVYKQHNHWLAARPKGGDNVLFTFAPPVALEEFFIRCWHPDHPGALFNTGTYIDVLPLFPDHVVIPKPSPASLFHHKRLHDGYITAG